MKFSTKDGPSFIVGGVEGFAVTTSAAIQSGDVAMLEVTGRHGRTKTDLSDRFYYVIKGEGTFDVGANHYEISKGDLVVVPKCTDYDFEGKMELLMFCSPAFDAAHEIPLEG